MYVCIIIRGRLNNSPTRSMRSYVRATSARDLERPAAYDPQLPLRRRIQTPTGVARLIATGVTRLIATGSRDSSQPHLRSLTSCGIKQAPADLNA
jgi:hypothetical protein